MNNPLHRQSRHDVKPTNRNVGAGRCSPGIKNALIRSRRHLAPDRNTTSRSEEQCLPQELRYASSRARGGCEPEPLAAEPGRLIGKGDGRGVGRAEGGGMFVAVRGGVGRSSIGDPDDDSGSKPVRYMRNTCSVRYRGIIASTCL